MEGAPMTALTDAIDRSTTPGRRKVRPYCYNLCGMKARNRSLFCSQHCAAIWAEAIAQGNNEVWCETCREWVSGPEFEYTSHQAQNPNHITVRWIREEDSVA